MFVSVIDTCYSWIYQQMQAVNSARQFGGVVSAEDWPQIAIRDSTLYLLVLDSKPANAQRDGSQYGELYENFVQWTWIVTGSDLTTAQVGANRGDRYRTNQQIKSDLRNAAYPGYCGKKQLLADSQGSVSFAAVTSPNGVESVWWSRLRFGSRNDNEKSGLVYGSAAFEIYGFEFVLPAVA